MHSQAPTEAAYRNCRIRLGCDHRIWRSIPPVPLQKYQELFQVSEAFPAAPTPGGHRLRKAGDNKVITISIKEKRSHFVPSLLPQKRYADDSDRPSSAKRLGEGSVFITTTFTTDGLPI